MLSIGRCLFETRTTKDVYLRARDLNESHPNSNAMLLLDCQIYHLQTAINLGRTEQTTYSKTSRAEMRNGETTKVVLHISAMALNPSYK